MNLIFLAELCFRVSRLANHRHFLIVLAFASNKNLQLVNPTSE